MIPYWENRKIRKLNDEDVELIKALRKERLKLREIADKFDVSVSHVHCIISGKRWAKK